MTTPDLLHRYAARRDAEAFAGLVAQYQAMVLATCRRRLHAPGDVDDAVQETFLKLAQKADVVRSNVGAWLHRCATNVAIDFNRRGVARQHHEQAAATGEMDRSASPALAELREAIDAALAKLNDADRELVLQRYFVGRPQTELAAEAGVSPAAVSQRLAKAVDALRDHLRGAGVPAAAVATTAGLVTLLDAERASAAVSPALTTQLNQIGLSGVGPAAGGGIMGMLLLGLAGAAALIVLAAAAWWMVWPSQNATAAAAGPTTAPAVTIADPAGVTTPVAPAWQADPAPLHGVLAGRVTDAAGQPIAGATVQLRGTQEQEATTDAQGRYAFAAVQEDGSYTVAVNARGFVPIEPFRQAGAVTLQLTAMGKARRNLVLRPAATVRVHVVDPAGHPVAKGDVRGIELGEGSPMRAAGIADGIATLNTMPADTGFTVTARADGYVRGRADVAQTPAGTPRDLTLTLQPAVPVHGIALGSDGKPATGWSISALPADWPGNEIGTMAKIDASGAFTLTDVAAGSYDLTLNVDDYGTRLGRYTLDPQHPLNVSLPRPSPAALATLKGRIHWTGDGSAHDIRLTARAIDTTGTFYFGEVRSPDDGDSAHIGEFTIAGLPAGTYALSFEGSRFESVHLDKVTVPGDVPTVELRMLDEPKLEGRVTDAAGGPVTAFAYRVRKTQSIGTGPNYVPDDGWVQVSDPNGSFSTDLVAPGVYQVQISAAGYAWTWSAPARAEKLGDTTSVTVTLTAGGELRGIVRDNSGHAVAGAKVIPLSMAQATSLNRTDDKPRFDGEAGAAVTDAAGRFALGHLSPGEETLRIVADGYAPQIVSGLNVVDGQTTDAPQITLGVGGAIEGTVYSVDGKPVRGTDVRVKDDRYFDMRGGGILARTTTDAAGHYRIDHLPVQTAYVSIGREGWPATGLWRRFTRPVDGVTTPLDFGGPTPLTGRLTDGSAPKPHWKLALSSGDRSFGATLADTTTGADGRFSFGGIPAGRYILYTDTGRERMPLRDVIVGDMPADLGGDLGDVPDDRGRAVLTIADPHIAAAIQGVSLSLDPALVGWPQPIGAFRPDGPGRWVCDDVPPGRSQVAAYDGTNDYAAIFIDRTAGQGEIKLSAPLAPATQPATQPARLPRLCVWLWSPQGLPLSNATVTLTDAAGQIVPLLPMIGQECRVFGATAGHYGVRVEQPGKPPFNTAIDFAGREIHLTVP